MRLFSAEAWRRRLDDLWRMRLHPKVAECRETLGELLDHSGLSWDRLTEESFLVGSPGPETIPFTVRAELQCLAASLERAGGDGALGRRVLSSVERAWGRTGKPWPDFLLLQKGINAQIDSDDTAALELFLAARRASKRPLERLVALVNALLCLENLGLPTGEVHGECLSLLRQLGRAELPRGVKSVLQAFALRHAFRRGELETVFAEGETARGETDRTTYFRLWASELPYHAYYGAPGERAKETFALADPHFFLKSYRLRTIEGRLHPDDLRLSRVGELADRFYLWTWRWLVGPEQFPLERVMALVPELAHADQAHRLTTEDYQFLRNALGWLALFDPAAEEPVARLVRRLRPPSASDYPLLELERLIVEHLRARRDGKAREAETLRATLEAHPLFRSRSLHLPGLVRSLAAPQTRESTLGPLTALERHIRALFPSPPSGKAGVRGRLVIDLASSRLVHDGRPLISAPMCLAFELLHRKGSVENEELLRIAFGLPHFDSFVHSTKISNLLTRMRQCAPPGLKLIVKSGRIYSCGSWDGVALHARHPLVDALQRQPEWRRLILGRAPHVREPSSRDRWVRPAVALKKLRSQGKREITREELEALTGKSKSTTQRLIQRWLESGLLERLGNARNTRYRVRLGDAPREA